MHACCFCAAAAVIVCLKLLLRRVGRLGLAVHAACAWVAATAATPWPLLLHGNSMLPDHC
jgi:hypothetical protein